MYFEDEEADAAVMAQLERGPVPDLSPSKIFDGVADPDTAYALINRYGRSSPFADHGYQAGQWFETGEGLYWHFLECLPPLVQTSYGFVVGECVLGDLYVGFVQVGDRVFCVTVRAPGSDDLRALFEHIRQELGR